ncbi:glycoside hydrolase family 16 protein [Marinilabiliaceae bacterium JC017]|nr:glycoside hydrolase family 16 protein [Marinilabiliaceae bacterium JC017]
MASLLTNLFGNKYPDTNKYESQINNLAADHKRFTEYKNSSIYARYKELDALIHSGEFKKNVHRLKTEKFRDTDEFKKYQTFKSLKKAKDIKQFLQYETSGKPEKTEEIKASAKYNQFSELEKFINSEEFKNKKRVKGFKKSEEYQKLIQYKKLKKDTDIKFIKKQLSSTIYKNYNTLLNSDRISNYKTLAKYIGSNEFIEFKAHMEDRHRFKKSNEAGMIKEHHDIISTPDYKWFQKTKKDDPFKELNKWENTFKDDFDTAKLDASKWITGYYWGKALLNDTYVLANERQFFKDDNIETRDSKAHIVSKTENCSGKIWDSEKGFIPAKFNYTSGLISTGHSFRQLYGKFEAKIKFDKAFPFTQTFWMVAEKIAPQIDVFKYGTPSLKTIEVGTHIQNSHKNIKHTTNTINGTRFDKGFFIYSLEWTPESLIWKINGIEVHKQTIDIPNVPMYLVFSSNLMTDETPQNMPCQMEIDWVRCYKLKE